MANYLLMEHLIRWQRNKNRAPFKMTVRLTKIKLL